MTAATTYEVQGRRSERGPNGRRREIVRLDRSHSCAGAFAIAEQMTAEKLKAWVFERQRRSGRDPIYKLVGVVEPKNS